MTEIRFNPYCIRRQVLLTESGREVLQGCLREGGHGQ